MPTFQAGALEPLESAGRKTYQPHELEPIETPERQDISYQGTEYSGTPEQISGFRGLSKMGPEVQRLFNLSGGQPEGAGLTQKRAPDVEAPIRVKLPFTNLEGSIPGVSLKGSTMDSVARLAGQAPGFAAGPFLGTGISAGTGGLTEMGLRALDEATGRVEPGQDPGYGQAFKQGATEGAINRVLGEAGNLSRVGGVRLAEKLGSGSAGQFAMGLGAETGLNAGVPIALGEDPLKAGGRAIGITALSRGTEALGASTGHAKRQLRGEEPVTTGILPGGGPSGPIRRPAQDEILDASGQVQGARIAKKAMDLEQGMATPKEAPERSFSPMESPPPEHTTAGLDEAREANRSALKALGERPTSPGEEYRAMKGGREQFGPEGGGFSEEGNYRPGASGGAPEEPKPEPSAPEKLKEMGLTPGPTPIDELMKGVDVGGPGGEPTRPRQDAFSDTEAARAERKPLGRTEEERARMEALEQGPPAPPAKAKGPQGPEGEARLTKGHQGALEGIRAIHEHARANPIEGHDQRTYNSPKEIEDFIDTFGGKPFKMVTAKNATKESPTGTERAGTFTTKKPEGVSFKNPGSRAESFKANNLKGVWELDSNGEYKLDPKGPGGYALRSVHTDEPITIHPPGGKPVQFTASEELIAKLEKQQQGSRPLMEGAGGKPQPAPASSMKREPEPSGGRHTSQELAGKLFPVPGKNLPEGAGGKLAEAPKREFSRREEEPVPQLERPGKIAREGEKKLEGTRIVPGQKTPDMEDTQKIPTIAEQLRSGAPRERLKTGELKPELVRPGRIAREGDEKISGEVPETPKPKREGLTDKVIRGTVKAAGHLASGGGSLLTNPLKLSGLAARAVGKGLKAGGEKVKEFATDPAMPSKLRGMAWKALSYKDKGSIGDGAYRAALAALTMHPVYQQWRERKKKTAR